MDQRPQHGFSVPAHAGDLAHAQEAAPWPTAPPAPGAPIAGTAPHYRPMAGAAAGAPIPAPMQVQPQSPGHQQFQFAGGYVVPGAGQGHPAPMAANGGTIGVPMPEGAPQPPMHGLPMPAGYQHPQAHPQAAMYPTQPQTWAYPTPNGLQMVQSGAAAPMVAGAGVATQRGARRVRWETIVPGAAVLCLLAAIGLFIHDFDRITGRDGSGEVTAAATGATEATEAAAPAASDVGSDAATPADVDAVLGQAQDLFQQGRFADASNLLHPLLDGDAPDQRVIALHDRVDAAAARNTALLKRLSGERRAGKWTAVIRTVGQLEALRPLSPQLKQLRAKARANVKQAQARAKAQAAARAKARQAAAARPAATGGGGNQPPRAGGTPANAGSAQPPANVAGGGGLPPRPDAPNPTNAGAAGAGAGAVGAAPTGGANCHEHDGVVECH